MNKAAFTDKLSKKQRKFIQAKAEGHTGTMAATIAGYAVPKQEATRLMSFPQVQAALRNERETLIAKSLAPKALKCMEGILDDEGCNPNARARVAIWVMEAAGHVAPKAVTINNNNKIMTEMTEEELFEFLQRSRQEVKVMEAGMIDVDSQQDTAQIVPQS